MANTLTISSLSEYMYSAMDKVAREPTGFIQGCMVNSGNEGVSINGTVQSLRTAEPTLNTSYTPAMTIPAGDDQTLAVEELTIGQVANVRIPLTGETVKKLDNTVGGQRTIEDLFAQAIRKIVNTIEARAGVVLKNGSSRATGTAGTNPFATDQKPLADLLKILKDNGCPVDDGSLNCVIDTTSGANLRKVANLFKVNEAGSPGLLRNGELTNLYGFSIRESAGVASHTKGTATGYDAAGGEAAGETVIAVDGSDAGTILAGDIVTFAGDSNKYVVKSATASGNASGNITLNHPGLRVALADTVEGTTGANYTGNIGFHRSAAELVMRPPAQPYGGDAAVDRMTIRDENTGLVFDFAHYLGYGMAMYDITTFYEVKVWKPEFVATLLG